MKMLFIAADAMEFRGMVARATDVRPAGLPLDFARTARLGGHEVLLAAHGAGWDRAAAAVDAALPFRADAVVSTGFCGAVDERLAIGDVVVATEVVRGERVYQCRAVEAAHRGRVVSIDHVAGTAMEKAKLRAGGASAVEMEAAAVAERAQAAGLPFYCIRVVTDLAGENLENDYNGALRADGHFDTMFILREALRHPTVRIPELLRLRGRCSRAAQKLGDFIVGCRF
jgi:nucleoside phosphorylase